MVKKMLSTLLWCHVLDDTTKLWHWQNQYTVSCFEPSQPQSTSRLNTNFIPSPSYSFHKSLHHKSHGVWAYLYSAGTKHWNLHLERWPILFCGPTQEPVLAAANRGKTWEKFWKKCRWMDRKAEISTEEIPGSKCSMHGNVLTYSRL